MLFHTRRIDPIDDEDHAEELQFLDLLCFGSKDAKLYMTNVAWWVIYHRTQPVAYTGLRRSTLERGQGYIPRMGVHPKWRGHSLQLRLLRLCKRKAAEFGYRGIVTDTSRDNTPSANNFIKAGFHLYV